MRQFNDIVFDKDGDFVLENGHLKVIENENPADAFLQYCYLIFNSKPNENLLFRNMGIDLDKYIGETDIKQAAFDAAKEIKLKITQNTQFYAHEVQVLPFPISKSIVGFKAFVNGYDNQYVVSAYDSSDKYVRKMLTPSQDK